MASKTSQLKAYLRIVGANARACCPNPLRVGPAVPKPAEPEPNSGWIATRKDRDAGWQTSPPFPLSIQWSGGWGGGVAGGHPQKSVQKNHNSSYMHPARRGAVPICDSARKLE